MYLQLYYSTLSELKELLTYYFKEDNSFFTKFDYKAVHAVDLIINEIKLRNCWSE